MLNSMEEKMLHNLDSKNGLKIQYMNVEAIGNAKHLVKLGYAKYSFGVYRLTKKGKEKISKK